MYKKKPRKILAFLVVLLLFVEVSMIWLMNKSLPKNNIPNILTKENIINNNMFAIMLETSEGIYEEAKNISVWPNDMIFNSQKSGCVDKYGNIIVDALLFDTTSNTATVYTETTGNCYLYFDLSSN